MSLFDQFLPPTADRAAATRQPPCSRKACRNAAAWILLWNNPKIHDPQRRKQWLACADHRQWLEEYLQTRGLWKDTVALFPDDGADA